MDVREKLVELIGSTEYGNGSLVGKNFQKGFIEKIASKLIAHGATVQEWISVKDRLPEESGEYIVFGRTFGNQKPKIWICECISIGSLTGWCNSAKNPTVTHWMPLPQPPKGE